jgi:hypothetical protein
LFAKNSLEIIMNCANINGRAETAQLNITFRLLVWFGILSTSFLIVSCGAIGVLAQETRSTRNSVQSQNNEQGKKSADEKTVDDKQAETESVADTKNFDAAVQALIATSRDDATEVRLQAIKLLGNCLNDRKSDQNQNQDLILRRLRQSMFSDDKDTARVSQDSFQNLVCPNEKKLKLLIEVLRSGDLEYGEQAEALIIGLAPSAEIVKQVANLIADKNTENHVRRRLFTVLESWGAYSAPATTTLAKLYGEKPQWRARILSVFLSIGKKASSDAMPVVTKALRDEEANIRLLAVKTMESILYENKPRTDRTVRSRSSVSRSAYVSYVDGLMKTYDTNRNGVIDRSEATRMRRNLPRSADKNRDGNYQRSELIEHYAGSVRARNTLPIQ